MCPTNRFGEYRPYNYDDNHNALVGYLSRSDGKFYCDNCIDKHCDNPDDIANVYLCNILPYRQPCADCKKLVVSGCDVTLFD